MGHYIVGRALRRFRRKILNVLHILVAALDLDSPHAVHFSAQLSVVPGFVDGSCAFLLDRARLNRFLSGVGATIVVDPILPLIEAFTIASPSGGGTVTNPDRCTRRVRQYPLGAESHNDGCF